MGSKTSVRGPHLLCTSEIHIGYYNNSENANVIFTRSVRRTKCKIVSHSKNVLTQRYTTVQKFGVT